MKCLILGTPGDVRVKGFQDALLAFGHPPAEVISYPDWIHLSEIRQAEHLRTVNRVRIESPGRDPDALHAIKWRWQSKSKPAESVSPQAIHEPAVFASRMFECMDDISRLPPQEPIPVFLNDPIGITVASDKVHTVEILQENQVSSPQTLATFSGAAEGYEDVSRTLQEAGINRAFIKLRHGYSGSGVVAYQYSKTNRFRELAITTVAMQRSDTGTRLFNTRRLQRYTAHGQVRALFDALCPLGVYVEPWIPKAGVNNRTTDLRVVTIAGEVRHIVLRMSRSPITNLHLLNERSDPGPLKDAMRPRDWGALVETCEKVARCFPDMLYLGIDIAVHADLRGHTVLEVNAFGDLLHGVTDRGQNTYEAEVEAMADWSGRLD